MPLLTIPSGTPIMLGTPARPMPEVLSQTIGTMLSSVDGVVEAHLPECFAVGIMAQPAQVLVVVINSASSSEEVVDEILLGLSALALEDLEFDVLPISPEHSLLASVQATNCRLV